MLTENHCNMYYTIHFTIVIASSYATSADAVDDSLEREKDGEVVFAKGQNVGCVHVTVDGMVKRGSLTRFSGWLRDHCRVAKLMPN